MLLVHAADLHLDSPLHGLPEYEGAPLAEIRGATRRAFENLVGFCLEEEARLLLLVGDLYDGDFRDFSTGLFLTEQLSRLREVGTRVVWLRGNHDAESRITRHLHFAEGVSELATGTPETLLFDELGVAVHGQGYARADLRENLARAYPRPLSGAFNVGMLHTALEGRAAHGSYAPCSASELYALGYEYFALGHVHEREVIGGDAPLVFPGNLQGRHVRERGPKGATVLEVEGPRLVDVRPVAFDVVRWEHLRVDVSECTRWTQIAELATASLLSKALGVDGRTLAARVELVGTSRAHGDLLRHHSDLVAELRRAAVEHGSIYLEEVRVRTAPETRASSERSDALASLLEASERIVEDEGRVAALRRELEDLLTGIPLELREDVLADFEGVLRESLEELRSRLGEKATDG